MQCCFYPTVFELLALFYDPAGFSDSVQYSRNVSVLVSNI